MDCKTFVLCDPELDYARQMAAFLEKDRDFPWKVAVYSDLKDAEQYLQEKEGAILLLAESLAEELQNQFPRVHMVLLNESGRLRFPEIEQIDKYQAAENVRRELLSLFVRQEQKIYPEIRKEKETVVIGLYSPVGRCLQTGFSLAYSQLLARKQKVLYLNLGYYTGVWELEAEMFLKEGEEKFPAERRLHDSGQGIQPDMSALLYYLEEEPQKFRMYMKSMIQRRGDWHFIAPMRNSTNLPGVLEKDWLSLLERCKTAGEYDCIVLDLSESVQGLFELLKECDHIVTIVKEDVISSNKVRKYEYMLERSGYGYLSERTKKLILPVFEQLPQNLEEYTRGPLAEYVEELMQKGAVYGIWGMEAEDAE